MPTINLKLSHTAYPVVIGSGKTARLQQLLHKYARGKKLFIVFDAQVFALYGEHILRTADVLKTEIQPFVLPQGEGAKSERVLAGLYEFLLANKIARSDFILACGGGVTTDVTGYAAATILRGVPWGAVPTTLLGMVDAAIGGKTGINHPLGKNLIGAIWQPAFVSCDIEVLHTLPRRELIAGCGELMKYAGLVGEPMLSSMKRYLLHDDMLDLPRLSRLIRLGAQYKAQVVCQDEREQNVRAYLNFGHTFGHAIEHTLGYGKLLHGEAVILGLAGAVRLSEIARPRSRSRLADYCRLVEEGVALIPAQALTAPALLDAMALDKKRFRGALRFVLLDRPGKPYIASDLSREQIRQALEEMLAVYREQGGRHATSIGRQRSKS